MTARAPAWFETKYIDGVTHILQDEGFRLKSAVSSFGEIKGSKAVWKLVGTGEASTTSRAIENVPVMNADRTTVEADMVDYEANDWIKTTDITKMSANEEAAVQKTGAMALGRRFDKIIVDALDAEAGVPTIGNGSVAFGLTDFLSSLDEIEDIGIGGYDYVCILPRRIMTQLEMFREFSSADYVGQEYPLLRKAGARQYRNTTFIPLPTARFTVPAANQLDFYLYNKDCVGFVPNMALKSRIDYVPEKKAWLAANDMAGAAKVLQPNGVRRLRFATNVALSRPNP